MTSNNGMTNQSGSSNRAISNQCSNIIIDNAGVYIPQINGIQISIQKTPMTALTGVIVHQQSSGNNTRKIIFFMISA